MIKIKDKDKEAVFRYVKEAISLYEPSSSGFKLKNQNIFIFDEYIYALLNRIGTPIKCSNDMQSIIARSIKEFSESSELTFENFECILNKIDAQSSGKKEKFYFVFTTNIVHPSIGRDFFDLLGLRFNIADYEYIAKTFNLDSTILGTRIKWDPWVKSSLKLNLVYFVTEVYAVDENSAMQMAYERYELLRSIINFVNRYNVMTIVGYEGQLLSFIYPPKISIAFDSDKKYKCYWITRVPNDPEDVSFDSGSKKHALIDLCDDLVAKINLLDSDETRQLNDMIRTSIMFYGNGLDHNDKSWASFLCYWQIFELITLARENSLKHRQIRDRVAYLLVFMGFPDYYTDIIDVISRKRNALVHEAKFDDFSHVDINTIRIISEHLIHFLIEHAEYLKTTDRLQFFYNNISASEDALGERKDILDYIYKFK